MAIAEAYSGSTTLTVNTPFVLNSTNPDTTDGTYQVFFTVSSLLDNAKLKFQIFEEVNDTSYEVYTAYVDKGSGPVFNTPAILLVDSWRMQVTQLSGTGVVFEYSVRKVS